MKELLTMLRQQWLVVLVCVSVHLLLALVLLRGTEGNTEEVSSDGNAMILLIAKIPVSSRQCFWIVLF